MGKISTILFAPRMRAVQPAFEYTTETIPIYFSLSSFNNKNQIGSVKWIIKDPNQTSKIFANGEIETDKIYVANSGEYYINIPVSQLTFEIEKYYQIQLILVEINSMAESEPSRISLLWAIGSPYITLSLTDGIYTTEQLKNIQGSLYFDGMDDSQEYLDTYQITLEENSKKVFSTGQINNSLGRSFDIKIDYNFKEGTAYTIIFSGKTVHGYDNLYTEINVVTQQYATDWDNFLVTDISNNPYSGSVEIASEFKEEYTGKIFLQRTDNTKSFSSWSTIATVSVENINGTMIFYDYLIDGIGTEYRYRFLNENNEKVDAYTPINETATVPISIISSFEDIFLSNNNKQLSIKYNPSVTNYKWVVQENITNSLGGQYPIIRRNGKTKYRQFTLGGTIYCDESIFNTTGQDSRGEMLTQWFSEESACLFLSPQEALQNNLWSNPIQTAIMIYEQKFKEAAMNFLTDGQPKLFRSPTEGLMLVILTNVSFTPNKTLGRKLVDFTATVTEFAEPTLENFSRYGIIYSFETVQYAVLKANDISISISQSGEEPIYIVTPLINVSQIGQLSNSDYNYLILQERGIIEND